MNVEKELKEWNNTEKYRTQMRYFGGENPTILDPVKREQPDNRIAVPIARRAVTLIRGYMAQAGNISYEGDIEILYEIFNENNEQQITSDELEKALIHGVFYELHWMENNVPQFDIIPVEQGKPIYSDDLRPKLKGFIRKYKNVDGILVAIVYDEFEKVTYNFIDEILIEVEREKHAYGKVPVVVGRIASDGRNLFDHVTKLIDLLDRIISEDIANELSRFANEYLLLADRISTELDDNEESEIDKIKRTRTIEGLADNVTSKVAYLTRNVNDTFIQNSADRTMKLIWDTLMLFDPSSQDFAGQSGNAQAWKMLSTEYLCAGIETYFSRALYARIELIESVLKNLSMPSYDSENITIKFSRSLPFDTERMAIVASTLTGIWDKKSILNLFPEKILSHEAKESILLEEEDSEEIPDDVEA